MAPGHRLWGKPLEDYTDAYCFDIGYHRPHLDSDDKLDSFLETVESGINQISEFGLKGDLDCVPASRITLSTLQAVAALEFSPHAFRYLASPPLIQGASNLRRQSNKETKSRWPFSYEYGYLCFRIMAFATSTCLLDRANKLDSVTEGMKFVSDEQLILILNEEVTALITNELENEVNGLSFDEILGWSSSSIHDPMLSNSDASLLLTLLWTDRKLFTQVVGMTDIPELVGLMFASWRYWRLEEESHPGQAGEILLRFSDVFWRYCCNINELEDLALSMIHRDVAVLAEKWLPHGRSVDLEDSRNIVQAYIGRVESFKSGSMDHGTTAVSLAAALLRFVVSRAQSGTEDLFPSLFKATFEGTWDDVI